MSYPSDTKVDIDAEEADFAGANGLPPALQPSESALQRKRRRIRRIVLFVFLGVFVVFHLFKTYNHFHERHDWSVAHHEAKVFYLTNDVSDEDLAPPRWHREHPDLECVSWTDPSATPTTFSFNVSTASDVIKLMSRGPFVGSVNFVQADNGASQEYIGVDVDLSWSKPDDESETRAQKRSVFSWLSLQKPHRKGPKAGVCAFKAKSGEAIGVGLFARPSWKHGHGFSKHHHPHHPHGPHPGHPHWPFPHPPSGPEDPDEPIPPHRPHHPHFPVPPPPHHPPHHLNIGEEGRSGKCHRGHHYVASSVERDPPITAHVTVTIPSGPLALQAFSSIFPGLSQSAQSAFDDVIFDSVSIVSAHGQLDISNLKAAEASILTDGKPITGTFTVSEKLSIVTSNASVDVNVTLISTAAQDRTTLLEIVTKDAPITTVTNLVLASPPLDVSDDDGKNGAFRISTVTSSAPVVVTITSQPVSSILRLSAVTQNDDVQVTLPPAYEGKFALVASMGGESAVIRDEDTPDPEGKGRKRLVDIEALFGGTVIGSVSWVDTDANEALAKEQMEWDDALWESSVIEEPVWDLLSHIELLTSRGDTKLFLA